MKIISGIDKTCKLLAPY